MRFEIYMRLTEYTFRHIFRFMHIDPKDLFSALSHDIRLRCILLLQTHEELCVCEITYAIGAAQPQISRSLAQLRETGLVVDRREGLWIHYRINPSLPGWVRDVLDNTAKGISRENPFSGDIETLKTMPNRPGASRCA